jgi:nicotinamidase-related amidase
VTEVTTAKQLPIPPFFDPRKAEQVWRVPYAERFAQAQEWARRHGVQPAAGDRTRVCLMVIDAQNTFCLPDFELFVAGGSGRGAIDDNVRLCEFIYRNLGCITEIDATLDTHTAMQIFHPLFWVNPRGGHPAGNQTTISYQDVESGAWKVNPAIAASIAGGDQAALERHARHYTRRLTEGGKYPLMVWTFHAMLGGIGHALVASVEEALFFHNCARASQTGFAVKGDNPLTEHYSALRPEVLDGFDGRPIAGRNAKLVEKLLRSDVVIVAGQAKSHCVAWTLDDLLAEIAAADPALAGKVYLLEDCTSPVVIPGVVDFTRQAAEAFGRFRDAGVHVVRSTDPIASWPGVTLG